MRSFKADATNMGNKVATIKAIRALTGMGLKEVKDLVETVHFEVKIDGSVSPEDLREQIESMKAAGVHIKGEMYHSSAFSMMEDAMQEALIQKDYDLAEDILQLLKRHG